MRERIKAESSAPLVAKRMTRLGRNVIDEDFEIYETSPLTPGFYHNTYHLAAEFFSSSSYVACPSTAVNNCPKQWYWSAANPTLGGTLTIISGATNDAYAPNVYADEYIACVSDITFSNGTTNCYDLMAVYKVYGPSAIVFDPMRNEEVNMFENGIEITVYPNPNDGNFYLKLNGIESQEGQLLLYDLVGKEYMNEEIILYAETPQLIRLPDNISEGIYILSFRNQLSNLYFKIIIDKP